MKNNAANTKSKKPISSTDFFPSLPSGGAPFWLRYMQWPIAILAIISLVDTIPKFLTLALILTPCILVDGKLKRKRLSKGYANCLWFVLTLDGIGLMANSIISIHLLEWKLSAFIAIVLGSFLGWQISTAIFNERFSKNVLVFTVTAALLFGAPYAYGTLTFANTLLDVSPKTTFETKVLQKYIHNGGRSSRYILNVAPWGPFTVQTSEQVDDSIYDAVEVGSTVCPVVGAGFFGIKYFKIAKCP